MNDMGYRERVNVAKFLLEQGLIKTPNELADWWEHCTYNCKTDVIEIETEEFCVGFSTRPAWETLEYIHERHGWDMNPPELRA